MRKEGERRVERIQKSMFGSLSLLTVSQVFQWTSCEFQSAGVSLFWMEIRRW